MAKTIISADSHITEPPNCYIDFIESKWKDKAPVVVDTEGESDAYVIHGLENPLHIGAIAAAGIPPIERQLDSAILFKDLHLSGWDARYRVADQDRDGVGAEIIYPTIGMVLCNHEDGEYKQACMLAYNRWLEGFCEVEPERIFGLGQTAIVSVEQAIKDLHEMKAMGFVGVMMPGSPATEFDYDDERFNPLWEAAIELDMPLSFHILTTQRTTTRGPKINGFMSIIRGCQDVIGMFIFSGVFDRYPELKLVCAEADAGWVPHFMYRLDHAYNYHRYWLKAPPLDRMPSEYFRKNVAMTFQDDSIAFQTRDMMNIERLMWASDFPHSDSTWPNSQAILKEQTASLTQAERDLICHDNVKNWYNLPVQ